MNEHNLIPNHERSPNELREMGRKGGIKSGEVRRKKRDKRKLLKLYMQVFADLEEIESQTKPERSREKRSKS